MGIRIIPPKRIKKAKTLDGQEVLERLNAYLDEHADEPVRMLCGFWKDQQNAISYQELRRAVMAGVLSMEAIRLWQQDYSVLVRDKMSKLWKDALSAGPDGQPFMDGLKNFKLDMERPGILQWINQHGAEFVTNCTQDQKDAIASLLAKKMRDGHTVDELARMIRPCIGLTKGQAEANAKYYDHIVETLTKDHPKMSKESIRKKALEASGKYAERQHRQRAYTIAQTESAFAYNRGADEGVRQAQEEGLLGQCRKRWSTSGDDAVCDMCAALDGVEVEMDESFGFKGKMLFPGYKLLPPAHPRCACAVEYIEVEPPQAGTAGNADADYLVRDYSPGIDTLEERAVVDEAVSGMPAAVREALDGGTVIDVGKPGACQYDYANDILYIAKGADKQSVTHEIGHMVDNKMLNQDVVVNTLKKSVGEVDIMQISSETFYDASGTPHDIFLLNSPSFVSEYQGRIYTETVWDAFDDDGNFKYDLMWEYVSEGFREYIENPANLLEKDPGLFWMLMEVML